MIVVDTSALMAILKTEAGAADCQEAIRRSQRRLMSAATLTEALIVAAGRGFDDEMRDLIALFELQVIELTSVRAEQAAAAYRQYGKNFHPASLNFGDCFAYATAKEFGRPLLYVGQDFARTDIASAIRAGQT